MKRKILITCLLFFIVVLSLTSVIYAQMEDVSNSETLPDRFFDLNLSDILVDPMNAIDIAQQTLAADKLEDEVLLDAYFVLGYAYWWIADMEDAKTWIDNYSQLAEANPSDSREMASDLLYVLYYKDIGESSNARDIAKSALERYELIKDEDDPNVRYYAMMISEKLAMVQLIDGELYNAANRLLEAMDYY